MIRRDFTRLAGLVVIAVALLTFAGLAVEVMEGDTLGFDRLILLALRSPSDPNNPIGPRWLGEVARDVTGLGSIVVLTGVTLAVAGYLALIGKRSGALLVLAAVGGGQRSAPCLSSRFNARARTSCRMRSRFRRQAFRAVMPCCRR